VRAMRKRRNNICEFIIQFQNISSVRFSCFGYLKAVFKAIDFSAYNFRGKGKPSFSMSLRHSWNKYPCKSLSEKK
jgi:hypothetical protein